MSLKKELIVLTLEWGAERRLGLAAFSGQAATDLDKFCLVAHAADLRFAKEAP